MLSAFFERFALVDFTGNLLCLHTVAGAGQQEYYGFFNVLSTIYPAVVILGLNVRQNGGEVQSLRCPLLAVRSLELEVVSDTHELNSVTAQFPLEPTPIVKGLQSKLSLEGPWGILILDWKECYSLTMMPDVGSSVMVSPLVVRL